MNCKGNITGLFNVFLVISLVMFLSASLVQADDFAFRLEAEDCDDSLKIKVFDYNTVNINGLYNWLYYEQLDFGTGEYYNTFTANIAIIGKHQDPNVVIEIRLDDVDGQLAGALRLQQTGTVHTNVPSTTAIDYITGIHDVYIVVTKQAHAMCKLDWIEFTNTTSAGQGTEGPMGPQGPEGPMGPAGPIGPAGADGIDGAPGLDGEPGRDGDGLDGVPGEQGPMGPAGADGKPGEDGTNGLDGLPGPIGPIGPAGRDGDGLDGAMGLPGEQGPIGPEGPIGPAGSDGTNGLDGKQGLIGPAGADGLNGTDGELGPDGVDGPEGPEGPQGLEGPEGPQGPDGPQGPAGPQGLEGQKGPQGPQGPAGADGLYGELGPEGPIGPIGPIGPDGLQGPRGFDGKQGLPGEPGENGTNGLNGQNGIDGEPGVDGIDGSVIYTGLEPISVDNSAFTIGLNPATNEGDLMTWDGFNWIAQPPLAEIPLPDGNMQPWMGVNHIIALAGIYPTRNGTEPFIAEIVMFGGNFAPRGWAFCDGQILSINQNSALFSLLGTNFGGDGRTTVGLPDLRGRTAVHPGQGPGLTPRSIGERGGTEDSHEH